MNKLIEDISSYKNKVVATTRYIDLTKLDIELIKYGYIKYENDNQNKKDNQNKNEHHQSVDNYLTYAIAIQYHADKTEYNKIIDTFNSVENTDGKIIKILFLRQDLTNASDLQAHQMNLDDKLLFDQVFGYKPSLNWIESLINSGANRNKNIDMTLGNDYVTTWPLTIAIYRNLDLPCIKLLYEKSNIPWIYIIGQLFYFRPNADIINYLLDQINIKLSHNENQSLLNQWNISGWKAEFWIQGKIYELKIKLRDPWWNFQPIHQVMSKAIRLAHH